MSDTKWVCLLGMVFVVMAFSALSLIYYETNECKVTYITSNRTATDINTICGDVH